mgnify:CR=1 FL=1
MLFARALVVINILLFIGLGIWCLVNPLAVAESLGIGLLTGSGHIEFMVLLAGSFLGISFVLFRQGIGARIRETLKSLFLIYSGWLMARLIGLYDIEPSSGMPLLFLGFEVVMMILLTVAYLTYRPRSDRHLFKSDLSL